VCSSQNVRDQVSKLFTLKYSNKIYFKENYVWKVWTVRQLICKQCNDTACQFQLSS
jgi:hypothetical protein